MAANPLTVLFFCLVFFVFNFYSKCQFTTAGGWDNRYVHILPLTSIYEVMYVHPDLDCRYQSSVLIIYTLCTAPLNPILVPLQLHKDKPSFPCSSSVYTSKSRIYTMKALSDGSAMFFMFVIYTLALLMKCMLSFNNYQPNMEQQEHVNIRKFQISPNQSRSLNL